MWLKKKKVKCTYMSMFYLYKCIYKERKNIYISRNNIYSHMYICVNMCKYSYHYWHIHGKKKKKVLRGCKPCDSIVECLPEIKEMWFQSLDQEHPLEEEMANHSNILAFKNPVNRRVWESTLHGPYLGWVPNTSITWFPHLKNGDYSISSKGYQD